MAVSRRLRFEILRRDNHACRYCGGAAPDVKLTVDHVVPVALGGSDDPENLVTACQSCNGGKAATSPDAPIVADVKADALRWARAIEVATNARLLDRERRDAYVDRFEEAWHRWVYTVRVPRLGPSSRDVETWSEAVGEEIAKRTTLIAYEDGVLTIRARYASWEARLRDEADTFTEALNALLGNRAIERVDVVGKHGSLPPKEESRDIPRPEDWKQTIWTYYAAGLPVEEMQEAVEVACTAWNVDLDSRFRYFCGVCWRKIEAIRQAASDVVSTMEEG